MASNLPLVGSFVWRAFTQVAAGTSVIVIVFAIDAAGSEVCRSRARTILIQA